MSLKEISIKRIAEMFDPKGVAEHEANFLVALALRKDEEAYKHYSRKIQSLYQISPKTSDEISILLKEAVSEIDQAVRHDKLVNYYSRLSFASGLSFNNIKAAEFADLQFNSQDTLINSDSVDATTWVLGIDPKDIGEGIEARNNAMGMVVELHNRLINTSATVFDDAGAVDYQDVGVILRPTEGDLENIRKQLEVYYIQVKSKLNQNNWS